MKKTRNITTIAVCILAITQLASIASATLYDYGNAQDYDIANHKSGEWQRLGENWDKETGPYDPSINDGVKWSIDGGLTFGHEDIPVGQVIIFQFDFQRAGYGRHSNDQLRAWIDYDGNDQWDGASELLTAFTWDKGGTFIPKTDYMSYLDQHGVVPNPDAPLQMFHYAQKTFTEDMVGTTWLRARVVCNTSIPNAGFGPYGLLNQGEVEDYQINIVPEPATMSLFAIGAMAFVRRRK